MASDEAAKAVIGQVIVKQAEIGIVHPVQLVRRRDVPRNPVQNELQRSQHVLVSEEPGRKDGTNPAQRAGERMRRARAYVPEEDDEESRLIARPCQ